MGLPMLSRDEVSGAGILGRARATASGVLGVCLLNLRPGPRWERSLCDD